jgi:hypothetical protein
LPAVLIIYTGFYALPAERIPLPSRGCACSLYRLPPRDEKFKISLETKEHNTSEPAFNNLWGFGKIAQEERAE